MQDTNPTWLRGTVLHPPDAEPGLLFVDGRQLPFRRDETWEPAAAPEPNMPVQVVLDESGAVMRISSVTAPSNQAASTPHAAAETQSPGLATATSMAKQFIERTGKTRFWIAIALVTSFFMLPAMTVSALGTVEFTFWQLCGFSVNMMQQGKSPLGLWSMVGLTAMAAPFIASLINSRVQRWFYAAPLVFCAVTAVKVSYGIDSQMQAVVGTGPQAQAMISSMFQDAYGFYTVFAFGLLLAFFVFRPLPARA